MVPPDLLVGTETTDDAAVYRLNDTRRWWRPPIFSRRSSTTRYDFGRIAATNAISDIYAMGGRPIMALAVVGMPLDKLPLEVIGRILAGGESVCAAAGIPIAGGHSIDVLEPIYGLVALGLVHPDQGQAQQRSPRRGCAHPRQAARRRHPVSGAQEGRAVGRGLRRDAAPHDPAEYARTAPGGHGGRACGHRCHRLRSCRPPAGDAAAVRSWARRCVLPICR